MKIVEEPSIQEFIKWLPGELVYSATKAGYDKKVGRAALPIDDPQSIYGFLGSEWFNHQSRKRNGVHYMPDHGMSAQLQLAKFAGGLFDKAGIAEWQASGVPAAEANFATIAASTAEMVIENAPWHDIDTHPLDIIDLPFEETPFADGIARIMQKMTLADSLSAGEERQDVIADYAVEAISLGGLAVACYEVYAAEYLKPEQLVLPESQLSNVIPLK